MSEKLQTYLIGEIALKRNKSVPLVEELVDLLKISKPSAYKKIKSQVAFTSSEVFEIATHYEISLDKFLTNGHGNYEKLNFDYSIPPHLPVNPEDFLRKVRMDLDQIIKAPNPFITYATNELPIFHSLTCPILLAFKLYVWSRTNWKISESLSRAFDPEVFYAAYPDIVEHRMAILNAWMQIPSKEFWPRMVLDNVLNQIRYYAEAQLFSNSDVPVLICRELLNMLDSKQNMAANLNKGDLSNGKPAATFELYLNEIAYTNNVILVNSGTEHLAAYITVDNPNFLRSTEQGFCKRMQQWADQIESCSFPAEKELHRLNLFNDLKGRVEMLMRHLERM